MDDTRPALTDDAVVRFVERLSPDGASALMRVYAMLVELGLRSLAEHPERLADALRDRPSADDDARAPRAT